MTLALSNITFDCADAAALATFYAQLLDRPVNPDANRYFATVGTPDDGPTLMFTAVPDKTPGKNAVHLDLSAPDWRPQIERAISLGAKHIDDFDEHGVQWATLSDPEGNLFDIGRG